MYDIRTPLLLSLCLLPACSVADGRTAATGEDVPPEVGEVEFRRVWSGSVADFYVSEPSPDGRYLSEVDWRGGDLAVLDLLSGKEEPVTNKLTWMDSVDYAEHSVFAPEGDRLVYAWFSESRDGYQVREIGLDGSNPRILVKAHPDLEYISPEDWSPDGRWVLANVFRSDRSSAISLISTENGDIRTLKTSDWRHPFVSAFSPDGRWIAYDFQPDEEENQRDVFVMSMDGSRETRIVEGPANDILLGWLPTGGGVLYYSDRAHVRGIWMQRIRDGRPEGEPELIKADVWQLFPLGFSEDAYYYGVTVESRQVHVGTVSLDDARVIVPPTPVVAPSAGRTTHGTWSPDGQYFAYLHLRPGERRSRLVLRSAEGEETRELLLDLSEARALQWHPDGQTVTMLGTDRKGRAGVHRVDIRTGEHTVLLERKHLGNYRLGPEGRKVFFKDPRPLGEGRSGMRRVMDIVSMDTETGERRALYPIVSPGRVEFSPDGRYFTTREEDIETRKTKVKVGRTDGAGELRTVFESSDPIPRGWAGLPWTPDGRHVLVATVGRCANGDSTCEVPGSGRVLMVPVDGGEPTVLLEGLDPPVRNLAISPDGRRIAFESGNFKGEIWRMQNLPRVGEEPRERAPSP